MQLCLTKRECRSLARICHRGQANAAGRLPPKAEVRADFGRSAPDPEGLLAVAEEAVVALEQVFSTCGGQLGIACRVVVPALL